MTAPGLFPRFNARVIVLLVGLVVVICATVIVTDILSQRKRVALREGTLSSTQAAMP